MMELDRQRRVESVRLELEVRVRQQQQQVWEIEMAGERMIKSSNDAENGVVPSVSPSNHSDVYPSSLNDSSLDDALDVALDNALDNAFNDALLGTFEKESRIGAQVSQEEVMDLNRQRRVESLRLELEERVRQRQQRLQVVEHQKV